MLFWYFSLIAVTSVAADHFAHAVLKHVEIYTLRLSSRGKGAGVEISLLDQSGTVRCYPGNQVWSVELLCF